MRLKSSEMAECQRKRRRSGGMLYQINHLLSIEMLYSWPAVKGPVFRTWRDVGNKTFNVETKINAIVAISMNRRVAPALLPKKHHCGPRQQSRPQASKSRRSIAITQSQTRPIEVWCRNPPLLDGRGCLGGSACSQGFCRGQERCRLWNSVG